MSRSFVRFAVAATLLYAPAASLAEESSICTDRPTKANAVCTVPVGKVQVESSLAGWSLTRSAGARTEVLMIGSPVFKLGLSGRSDLQIGFTPYAQITTKEAGARNRVSGVGDVFVRYKHRLTAEGAPVQVAAIPFIKVPTAAEGLGNDRVEGGLAVPISFALAGPVTMTFGPELDLLANADGHGSHAALVNLVNFSVPVAPRLTLAGELWTNFNFDPDGTAKQASLDGALAYAATDVLQLDAGTNLGLTRDTPDVEVYAGASLRF